jgi:hypothetical protein
MRSIAAASTRRAVTGTFAGHAVTGTTFARHAFASESFTRHAVTVKTVTGHAVTNLTAGAGLRFRGKSHYHGSLLVLLA